MDTSLIAVISWLEWLVVILEVAIGLGMVIFVHELGHFAVAKLCGVKCEKFYLGFDIYGLKLAKFRWGETEYGIGILPLGGYVKMLGQDDNPARAAQERERSKLPDAADAGTGEPALDPRSYLAQSVPKRMAIISAGVIMNILFAIGVAIIAYRMGVPDVPCIIGEVMPGEGAWKAGMWPGDQIIQIGPDVPQRPPIFNDLLEAIAVGDIDDGIRFKIRRAGVSEPVLLTVHPDRTGKINPLKPTIGASPARSTKLSDSDAAEPYSLADKLDTFRKGDKIVAVNDKPVADYAHFVGRLADLGGRPVTLSVERKIRGKKSSVAVKLPKHPMRELGLIMQMGRITAVQDGSPAAEAGIKVGDRIARVNGHPVEDPLKLPQQVRLLNATDISLTLGREDASGREQLVENKRIKLRKAWWYEEPHPFIPGSPLSIPELGLAYQTENVVRSAAGARYRDKGRDAARLKAGDEIVKAELLPASKEDRAVLEERQMLKPVDLARKAQNWPSLMSRLQSALPGTDVRLTLADKRTIDVRPFAAADWFNPEIGIIPDFEFIDVQAATWSDAAAMGVQKTRKSLLVVYSVLRKLLSRQISPRNLGGPVEIGKQAGYAAFQGIPTLLLFLTILSANLAVINFLPIPLLDGGHMVFLALEGIQGKPVSERVVVAFHYVGFVFIISLMLFVLSLDFGLISRHGP